MVLQGVAQGIGLPTDHYGEICENQDKSVTWGPDADRYPVNPKKCISPFIFANSRRSMKAIVLHMAFAVGGRGSASRWQPP